MSEQGRGQEIKLRLFEKFYACFLSDNLATITTIIQGRMDVAYRTFLMSKSTPSKPEISSTIVKKIITREETLTIKSPRLDKPFCTKYIQLRIKPTKNTNPNKAKSIKDLKAPFTSMSPSDSNSLRNRKSLSKSIWAKDIIGDESCMGNPNVRVFNKYCGVTTQNVIMKIPKENEKCFQFFQNRLIDTKTKNAMSKPKECGDKISPNPKNNLKKKRKLNSSMLLETINAKPEANNENLKSSILSD
jgi:hypothetical protein